MPRRFATADIGSNTVHLLVAEINGNQIKRLQNDSVWLSLGEVVSKNGFIPVEQATQLVDTLKRFRRDAEFHGAEQFYVFATEAMRVAKNHHLVLQRIRDEAGVQVDLIPAKREAELSFRGIHLDSKVDDHELMIEVGGGSAQIAEVKNGIIINQVSLKLGTGRLIALSSLNHPATSEQLTTLRSIIRQELDQVQPSLGCNFALASGGVARGLVRALHPDGDLSIQLFELDYILASCSELTTSKIVQRFNVKTKRAESIIPGAMVYSEILRHFDFQSVMVSEFGVREGAIMELAEPKVTL